MPAVREDSLRELSIFAQTSWTVMFSRVAISYKASHMSCSRRTDVRRPAIVMFRFTRVL
jgi:hypothetical protein